jgi:hypothetical protein
MNISHALRWVAAVSAAGLAAGVLAAPALAVGSPTGPARARVPACTNADLAVTYRHTDDSTGHRFGLLRITNVSGHRCRTGGYGGVSYVGHGDGTQIGAAADRDPGTVRSYVLRPGHRLVSPLSETVAGNYPKRRCRPAHVKGFRVYVPNATRAQFVAHPTTGCRNRAIHLMSHQPYRRP